MEDKNPVLGLAFNVKNPDESVIKMLEEEFKARKIDENMWAFPYDANVGDYDKFGAVLGSFFVGIINSNDYSFYPNETLNKDMLEFSGEDPEDDGSIPLAVLPDVEDFTVDNADDIKAAIEEVRQQHYSYTVNWPESDQQSIIGEKSQTFPEVIEDNIQTEDIVPENNDSNENSTNSAKSGVESDSSNVNAESQGENIEDPDEKNSMKDVVGDIFGEEQNDSENDDSKESQKEQQQFPHIQGKPDLALTLAADIFTNKEPLVLQGFDEATQKQLAPDYIKAQATVGNKADQTIYAMAEQIRNSHETFAKEFDDEFKDSINQHEDTLKKIDIKAQQDIEKAEKNNAEDYQVAKEKYVEANRPRLEAEFDKENKNIYSQNLEDKKKSIQANAAKLKETENSNYQKVYNEQSAHYIERRIRQIDFSDLFNDYENVLQDETDHLAELATSFVDQVAVVTGGLTEQNEALKQQNVSLSRENDILNRTMNEQVKVQADKKASDRTVVLQQQLTDLQLTNNNLKGKIHELQNKNDELSRDNRSLKRTQKDLLDAKEIAEKLIPAKQKVVEVQKAVSQPIETTTKSKKTGHTNKIVGILAGVLITLGLGTAYLGWQSQQVKNSSNSEQQTIQVTPSNTSNFESHHYKKGDTFTYYSDKDKKDYTITMDDDKQGHYTDAKGNYHQVTLKEGN